MWTDGDATEPKSMRAGQARERNANGDTVGEGNVALIPI